MIFLEKQQFNGIFTVATAENFLQKLLRDLNFTFRMVLKNLMEMKQCKQ